MILLDFSNTQSDKGVVVRVNSSVDLRSRELSLGLIMRNGQSSFADWSLSFDSFTPMSLTVESVLNTKDRLLVKIPEVIGTTFVYKGKEFHTVGKSNGYSVVEGKVPGLSTGDTIDVLTTSYHYDLLIKGVVAEEIQDALLTVGNGEESVKRSIVK